MILVTGGAGFIGSHVVDALLAGGHEVRVLDALLPAAHRERPDYVPEAAEWLEGDLRDPDVAARAVRGVTAVSHQAAMVGLGVDLGDLPDYVGHNDLATAQLLRALAAAGFSGRLVLASSMVVYGEGRYVCPVHDVVVPPERSAEDLDAGRFEPRCPLCDRELASKGVPEDAPLDPRSVYAATKLAQEHLCAAFARETGVPVTALRYHNVYGPRMPRDTPYAGVASIFRSAFAAGRAPRVFEDGGTAARLRPRPRRGAREPPRAHRARAGAGRLQRRERHAAHGARDGARARDRLRRPARGGAAGHGRVARRRRPPHRRLARAGARAARLRRAGGLRGGHGGVRLRPAARLRAL